MNIIKILDNANKSEVHLARLLILLNLITEKGIKNINGITKLVKLDFFLRYPSYLKRALSYTLSKSAFESISFEYNNIEAHMVRFLYGPWDDKYWLYLNILYAKKLITIHKNGNTININLTDSGVKLSNHFIQDSSFSLIVFRSELLKKYFDKKGAWLKNFIYKYFPEIKYMEYGEVITK